MAELRARRSEARAEEAELSLQRRLVQGRLDIVRAEQRRRASGTSPSLAAAVADLPTTLARPSSGPVRQAVRSAPVASVSGTAALQAQLGADHVPRLPDLAGDELDVLGEQLTSLERDLSRQRRSLFGTLDALGAELTRRYLRGEASAEDLLQPPAPRSDPAS